MFNNLNDINYQNNINHQNDMNHQNNMNDTADNDYSDSICSVLYAQIDNEIYLYKMLTTNLLQAMLVRRAE